VNINLLILLTFSVLNVCAGVYVLAKKGKSYLARPYFLVALTLSCYCVQFYLLKSSTIVLAKIFFAIAVFSIPALLNLLLYANKGSKVLLKILVGLSAVLSGITSCLILIVNPLTLTSFSLNGLNIPSMSYSLFFLNVALFGPLGLIVSIIQKKPKEQTRLARGQINFISFCVALINIGLLLTLIYALDERLISLGQLFVSVSFMAIAYAVVRYRLLERSMLIYKLILGILFVVPLLIVHLVISLILIQTTDSFLFISSFSIVVVISLLVFTPYKKNMKNIASRLVYRGSYDYQKVLKELTQTLTSILDLDQLCDYMVHVLVQTIEPKWAAVFLGDESEEIFTLKASYGIEEKKLDKVSITDDDGLVQSLKQNKTTLSISELRLTGCEGSIEKLLGKLAGINVELIVPLFFKTQIIGLIALSEKTPNRIYNQTDVNLLNDFAGEAAKATEHVRLYSEAIVDNVSGVFNQNYFLTRVRDEIARSKRYGHPISLIFIDLENFDQVRLKSGSSRINLLLKGIGLLLKTKLRNVDVLARYSTQRFSIIIPETAAGRELTKEQVAQKHRSDTMLVANRLFKSLEEFKNEQDSNTSKLIVSFGICCFDSGEKQFTEEVFIKQAQDALHRAKQNKKDKVVCY